MFEASFSLSDQIVVSCCAVADPPRDVGLHSRLVAEQARITDHAVGGLGFAGCQARDPLATNLAISAAAR